MSLRQQLLLVSVLLLVLPWSGWRFIQAMDITLRTGQAQALLASAQAIASRLREEPLLFGRSNRLTPDHTLYAHPLSAPVIIDGYDNDWRELNLAKVPFIRSPLAMAKPSAVTLSAAQHADKYYLYLTIADSDVRYFNPLAESPLSNTDHLRLYAIDESGEGYQYVLAVSAPGYVVARFRDNDGLWQEQHGIRGVWREYSGGYQLELELQRAMVAGYFDIDIVDNTQVARVEPRVLIAADLNTRGFLTTSQRLSAMAALFQQPGLSLQVLSQYQWLLADIEPLPITAAVADTPWLLRWIYRQALATDDLPHYPVRSGSGRYRAAEIEAALEGAVGVQWYRQGSQQIGRVAVPVMGQSQQVIGVVVVEKTSDQSVALTNSAFNQLFGYSIMVILSVVVLLLGYASWLSWRIRRLSHVAEMSVDATGKVSLPEGAWPDRGRRDEIGDLSRSYHQLLLRLQGYTDYLRTLANKLSHELRTPLAVVRSSLDNIDQVKDDPTSVDRYRKRALEGLDRLSQILTAMSAANQVEASIASADKETETIELEHFLAQLVNVYQDVYTQHRFALHCSEGQYRVALVPDLIVQMLDKLIDNATDFCPQGEMISLALYGRHDSIELRIENPGPLLPDTMQAQLFDSMVSLRQASAGQGAHMGLGLYIVRLIVDFHQGQVYAANLDDGTGVVFSITLPRK